MAPRIILFYLLYFYLHLYTLANIFLLHYIIRQDRRVAGGEDRRKDGWTHGRTLGNKKGGLVYEFIQGGEVDGRMYARTDR
jgi:hypothetical protein